MAAEAELAAEEAEVAALARTLRESMAAFANELPRIASWGELLQFRYPQVPDDVVTLHVVENDAHSQPPLELLCPDAGYKVELWEPDITEWPFKSMERTARRLSPDLIPLKPFLIGHDITSPFDCIFRHLDTVGICRPEGAVVARDGSVRAVIILDMVRLPDKLDVVLNRMCHYLELTGAVFGAVTCYSQTWLCKRNDRVLQVSPAHDMLCMAIGFLAYKSLNDLPMTLPAQPAASFIFDTAPACDALKYVCDALQVEHRDQILSGADVSGSFQLEDLENVKLLNFGCEKDFKTKFRAVRKARYRGKQVVVKTRDLSSPYYIGFMGILTRFIREVDAYFTLKEIQGLFVPKLLSWGFLRGAMFVYTITGDVGISRMEGLMYDERKLLQDRVSILPTAFEVLSEIHQKGLLHGDIDEDKLVTRRDDAGNWKLMLVGFGQSSRAEVFSKEWREGTLNENAELEDAIEVLIGESSLLKMAESSTSGYA